MSGYRLYITPNISVILFPIMVVLGVIAFVILIVIGIIAMFGGGNVPDCHNMDCHCHECCCDNEKKSFSEKTGDDTNVTNECCHECPNCAKFWAFLGVAFAALLWGTFVWIIMKLKLSKLNSIQQQCHKKYAKFKREHSYAFV